MADDSADSGVDADEGNEGEEELQLSHPKPGDGIPRSREFDALFLVGVTVLILLLTLVIFLIKP